MTLIRKFAAFIGATAVLYLIACAALFLISATLVDRGTLMSNQIMKSYQFAYYLYSRRHFFNDPACIAYDDELVYVPKTGECAASGPEFKTVMNFNADGRLTGERPEKIGIAIVGDSIAMGWGVHDDETFSAVLGRMLGRPVYNLGVTSYSTYRELRRLEKSGLLPKVDTVILQYCVNDFGENVHGITHAAIWQEPPSETTPREMYDSITDVPLHRKVWILGKFALKLPAIRAKQLLTARLSGKQHLFDDDFSPEYLAMSKVLAQFPWLKTKRVIIVHADGFKYKNFAEVGQSNNIVSATFVEFSGGPETRYAWDGHPNKVGHQKIAELLLSVISQRLTSDNTP